MALNNSGKVPTGQDWPMGSRLSVSGRRGDGLGGRRNDLGNGRDKRDKQ